jgi:hypothetical protein
MYIKPLIVTGAVLFAASAFAQTSSTTTSPGASSYTPGHQMQQKRSKTRMHGASAYAPGHKMKQQSVGMPNSTGNMNTKGTGRGTTGTGGRGGSGNR